MTKKERFKEVIKYFSAHQPIAETELDYKDPYQLLVAVILSAQCTDKRVNMITPDFYSKYSNSLSLSKANQSDVFELIKSCSYPNNKAKHLLGMAKTLVDKFDNIVPDNIDDLQILPGVGRKTANVILSVAFNKPAMAVDTHVFRVSARLGLTISSKTPFDTEKQLVKHIPKDKLSIAHHWLILHGRYICQARKPKCDECGLTFYCKYFERSKRFYVDKS